MFFPCLGDRNVIFVSIDFRTHRGFARSTVVGAESLPSIRRENLHLIDSKRYSFHTPTMGWWPPDPPILDGEYFVLYFQYCSFQGNTPDLKMAGAPSSRRCGTRTATGGERSEPGGGGRWVIQTRVEPKTKNQEQRAKARFSPKSQIRLEPVSKNGWHSIWACLRHNFRFASRQK